MKGARRTIKNIVFDMGGVLVFDNMMDFLSRYLEDRADCELLNRELFLSNEWKMGWDKGTMTAGQVAESVCGRLPERLHKAVRQVMENWMMEPRAIPGMENLIRAQKKAGRGIYLLSNTAAAFRQYCRKLPAIDCFDGTFISADYHLLKPNREIYEKFVQVFGLVPEECYFVDDKAENVKGARAAGWGGGFVFSCGSADSAGSAALEEALKSVPGPA